MTKRKHTRAALCGLLAAVAAAAFAAPAQAGLLVPTVPKCADQKIETPFVKWGDRSNYVLAPGGSFESGAPGWSLSGASVVSGNESFKVGGASHTRALSIKPNGYATSGQICVGLEHPTLRFFARSSGPALSTLAVEMRVKTSLGLTVSLPLGLVTSSSAWKPSPIILVVENLLAATSGGYTNISVRFRPVGGATWTIDDVYLDPKRR
jgi:hypothetical protein